MEERRQHPRYESGQVEASSLYLTAHDLAEGPIGPVDFGSGGFGVRLSRRPLQGSVVSCTLHVRGVALSGIPARDCIVNLVECRTCKMINAMDGLSADCNAYAGTICPP